MRTHISIPQLLLATLLLLAGTSLQSANDPQEVITISTAKFGKQLVEQWIKKYAESHPNIQIRLVEGKEEPADLAFLPQGTETAADDEATHVIRVGRYALLPVTTTEHPLYEQLSRRRLDTKGLKRLFFQADALQEVENGKKKDALLEGVTIYSGANRASGANAFAAHFGYQPAQLRGKRIAGDDLFLLTAIGKDRTGVTFNNLSYLFDLESRRLKPHLSLLPLDLKKEQNDILQGGDLDETLRLLENNDIDLIPLQEVGFSYRDKSTVTDFLRWIVSEGQQYNHAYGFLTLDKKVAQKEQKQLEEKLLTNR